MNENTMQDSFFCLSNLHEFVMCNYLSSSIYISPKTAAALDDHTAGVHGFSEAPGLRWRKLNERDMCIQKTFVEVRGAQKGLYCGG